MADDEFCEVPDHEKTPVTLVTGFLGIKFVRLITNLKLIFYINNLV